MYIRAWSGNVILTHFAPLALAYFMIIIESGLQWKHNAKLKSIRVQLAGHLEWWPF